MIIEEFLFRNRTLLNQIIRKFGTKDSGFKHLKSFYLDVMKYAAEGKRDGQIVEALKSDSTYSYLQPDELPYEGVAPTKMSTQVKSGLITRKLLECAPRCSICGGFVPPQAISVDHRVRSQDGGLSTHENTDLAHPYCNTGYKESEHTKHLTAKQSTAKQHDHLGR